MGGRELPTECPHGRIIDPGDFGESSEGCDACGIPAATWDDDGNIIEEPRSIGFQAWCADQAAIHGVPRAVVADIAWSYAAFVLRRANDEGDQP